MITRFKTEIYFSDDIPVPSLEIDSYGNINDAEMCEISRAVNNLISALKNSNETTE